jgi:hypothetical protein
LTRPEALACSFEQLAAAAAANRRRDARTMLEFMVAAQGDDNSWKAQQKMLLKELKNE